MTRIFRDLLCTSVLSLAGATCLVAQTLSADRFLEGLSKRPVDDPVVQDQAGALYQALNSDPPAKVSSELPILLRYTRVGNEAHTRAYAALFLNSIAIRPDGADLLSSISHEISALIVDADPGIQKLALAITDYVIAKPVTNKQPYVAALKVAIQKTQTPQDIAVQIVGPLLYARFDDPGAAKPVIDFMHRADLTVDTRRELVHSLGDNPGLPEEINLALSKELDDPDPTVRVAALVAYADSTTGFHTLSKGRVGRMANDPRENPKIRGLARQAVAGKTHLDPNVLLPHVERPPDKPSQP